MRFVYPLFYAAFVFLGLVTDAIYDVGFLQERVAFVLFVGQDRANGGELPFFSCPSGFICVPPVA